MKVLKAPDDGKAWEYDVMCSKCDAILRIDRGDVRYSPPWGDCRENGPESFSCTCAICKSAVDVPAGHVSEAVKRHVRDRYSYGRRG